MSTREPVVEVIDKKMVEILRNKTPAERLAISFGMWETARLMIRGALRQQHPDWNDEMINREIARRVSHGAVDNVSS